MKIFAAFACLLGFGLTHARDAAPPTPPLDVLIVAPHPDDETIGCAGVTLQALARKERVGIVVLTQGDAHARLTAVVAQKPAEQLRPEDFVRAGALRQGHTLRAAASLGVPEGEIVFLGYPDGGLAKMYREAGDVAYQQPLTGRRETYAGARPDYHSTQEGRPAAYTRASVLADLASILQARRPRAVYVTHETDRHPDHETAFWLVRDALRAAGSSARLFAFVVHGDPLARAPDQRVQLTAAQVQAKRDALLIHQGGVSPVHDSLATTYAQPEELFWEFAIR